MKRTMRLWISCAAAAFLLTGCGCGPKKDPAPIESASPTPTATIAPTPTPTPVATKEPEATATPAPAPTSTPSAPVSVYDPYNTGLTNKIGSATINVEGLRIRSGAGTGYSIVDVTKKGGTYPVYSVTSDGTYTWYQIGKNCWIADDGSWLSYSRTQSVQPTAAGKDTVHIQVEAIHIRSCPSTGCSIIGTAREGENYTVYAVEHGESYDWLKLADDAWIATDKSWSWVRSNETKPAAATSSDGHVVVKVEAVNVRSGPGTNYDIVGSVRYNDRVPCLQVIKNNDLDWVKIAEDKWIATDKGWTWIKAE